MNSFFSGDWPHHEQAYATAPRNFMKFVNFMYKAGHLKTQPESWKDLFFPEGQGEDGS